MGGIVFVAAFTQGAIGFGFGLVTMSVIPGVLGLTFAVALIALFSGFVNFAMLHRYRKGIDRRAAISLLIGAAIGVPLGIHLLETLDQAVTLKVLGAVVVGYALFQLTRRPNESDEIHVRAASRFDPWGLPVGAASGLLGGAFNAGGPPVIVYATLREFPQATFKGTINAMFATISVVQLPTLAARGFFTADVLKANALAAPLLALGLYIGPRLGERLDGPTFRSVVLVALLVLGSSYLLR